MEGKHWRPKTHLSFTYDLDDIDLSSVQFQNYKRLHFFQNLLE